MRIDIVTIFPDYFSPLNVSLIGKAGQAGLLQWQVHNLRDFTHDRHRTVDDIPYGGGAGMVMLPEPWAQALSGVKQTAAASRPTLIVPTPAGAPFTQERAHELSRAPHVIFACGRYEGIDERLLEWAGENFDLHLISIGDYIVNGGEVAALAMIEALARLLPGVVGNPESLTEESHESGLLEYPVYTRPAHWRGRAVPEVLLSGHHGRIEQYRRAEQLRRTAQRRPDLLAQYRARNPLSPEEVQLVESNEGGRFGTSRENMAE